MILRKIIMFLERSISIELDDNISPTKIGGKGLLIQIYETAICSRRRRIDFSNKNNTTNIRTMAGGRGSFKITVKNFFFA